MAAPRLTPPSPRTTSAAGKLRLSSLLPAALSLALPALAACERESLPPEPPSRIVLFSLDGNALWFTERLLADGLAPLYAETLAEHALLPPRPLISNYASITPAGFAALYTGSYGNVNGVTSFDVFKLPHMEYNLLDTFSGFSGDALLVPPIWIGTALAGRKTVVSQATQQFPLQVNGPDRRQVDRYLTSVDGLRTFGPDEVVHFADLEAVGDGTYELQVQGTSYYLRQQGEHLLVGCTPEITEPQKLLAGFTGRADLALKDTEDLMLLKPIPALLEADPFAIDPKDLGLAEAAAPVDESATAEEHDEESYEEPLVRFYLSWVDGKLDDRDIRLYHSAPTRRRTNRADLFEGRDLPPPAVPGGAASLYRQGALGQTLIEGGSGEAEWFYLQTVLACIDSTELYADWLVDRVGSGALEIYYLPFPDEFLHLWAGYMLVDSPVYMPELAPTYWRLTAQAMDRIGTYMARLLAGTDGRPAIGTFYLAADHGMNFATRYLYVNMIFEQAGLLEWKDKYTVDLERTSVLLPKGGGAFAIVNRLRYRDGHVPEEEVPAVLARATKALLAARDPSNREAPVLAVWPAEKWAAYGTGGPRGGDLYLHLADGYVASHYSTDGSIVGDRAANSSGEHGDWPLSAPLLGTFMRSGSRPPLPDTVEETQVAPMILRELGIELPPEGP